MNGVDWASIIGSVAAILGATAAYLKQRKHEKSATAHTVQRKM